MFPEVGDIVFINNAEIEEAIGHYGKITNLVGEDKVRVVYRHVMVFITGSFNVGATIVDRRDISLVCKVEDKTKRAYLESLLPRDMDSEYEDNI